MFNMQQHFVVYSLLHHCLKRLTSTFGKSDGELPFIPRTVRAPVPEDKGNPAFIVGWVFCSFNTSSD